MDGYEEFNKRLEYAVKVFNSIPKSETIRLISHLDADGLSAAAIMVKALERENRKHLLSVVHVADEETLKAFVKEDYKNYIFTDLGSGQISLLKKHMKGKRVIVLDHHEMRNFDGIEDDGSVLFLNPHIHGINGSLEISGSGVAFLFAYTLDKKNEDMSHIAMIGAFGDMQENNGFMRMNTEILDLAKSLNKVSVKKGLKFFGMQTRPLHKVLEYSTDPFIPGVSGSESGAIQFLYEVGINPRNGNGGWRKIIHLRDDELKKLTASIILKRMGEEKPEDVIGNIYLMNEEKAESPLKDLREFATLLNACGRMGNASLGVGACMGDEEMKRKAVSSLAGYKKEIVNCMKWYADDKNKGKVINGDGFIIIDAGHDIMATMIGTFASMLSKSNGIKENTIIVGMARQNEDKTKVSMRMASRTKDTNLKEVVDKICSGLNCDTGGHIGAAGALINSSDEERFLEKAKEVLGEIKCGNQSL